MEERDQDILSNSLFRIDPYSLVKDILKNLWTMVLCALIGGMLGNMYASYLSTSGNTYTTTAVMVVTTKGSSNYAYSNNSSAATTATVMTNILNSPVMSNYITKELSLTDDDTFTTSATQITDTNLVQISVTSGAAQLSFRVMNAILDNYEDLSYTTLGDVILETFQAPSLPTGANEYVNANSYMKRFGFYGLILSFLLVCFLSIKNDTIRSSEELSEKLDAKSLGVIYHENKYKTLGQKFRRPKTSLLISNPNTSFGFVESYKKICAKLSYYKQDDRAMILMITSVLENEGKSTVAANIAITFAKSKKKVLLMDCDFRRPAQNLVISEQKDVKYGLSDFLTGQCDFEDVIRFDEEKGIYTCFTKKYRTEAAELISGKKMEDLLAKLRQEFDYIVLDTPPLAGGIDAEAMADIADTSLLVVRYNVMQARDINDAIDMLNSCQSELTGCVLNQVRTIHGTVTGNGYGYGYRYGYGYGYGNYGNKNNE